MIGTRASHPIPQTLRSWYCSTEQSYIRPSAQTTTILPLTSGPRFMLTAPQRPQIVQGWSSKLSPSPHSHHCKAHAQATQATNTHRQYSSTVTQNPEEQRTIYPENILENDILPTSTALLLSVFFTFYFTAFSSPFWENTKEIYFWSKQIKLISTMTLLVAFFNQQIIWGLLLWARNCAVQGTKQSTFKRSRASCHLTQNPYLTGLPRWESDPLTRSRRTCSLQPQILLFFLGSS